MTPCSLCGATGPQVVLLIDPGRPAVPICSTADPAAANACADRETITKETSPRGTPHILKSVAHAQEPATGTGTRGHDEGGA